MKKTTHKRVERESDNAYFLKILLYFILGTIWVKYNGIVVFPIGFIVGIIFTRSDHFAIDRKIEYAILLVAALVGLMGGGVFLAL